MKKAVILFNLGGPDKLENVENRLSVMLLLPRWLLKKQKD